MNPDTPHSAPPDHQPSTINIPRLQFTHAGRERTLNKHTTVVQAYKRGEITLDEFKGKAWILRAQLGTDKERTFKLSPVDKDAIRAAKDILNGTTRADGSFTDWLAERDAKRGITIAQLAQDWLKADLPFSATRPRSADEADPLRGHVTRALVWPGWNKPALAITHADHDAYVVWRRQNTKRGEGSRSADLELAALSCCCQWALRADLITKNPFEARERYHAPEAVEHCHLFMPRSDEEFHRILSWFWTTEYTREDCGNRHDPAQLTQFTRVAGAWLAFTGLVGLRPEEPAYLFRYPRHVQTPGQLKDLPAGAIFPTRDGKTMMKVRRTKHGQNPFVLLHPVALDFLDAWTAWLDTAYQPSTINQLARPWFPSPIAPAQPICAVGDTTLLNKRLAQACAAVKLEHELKPKGLGRAYYVRVRRSQGADDATIAGELGQTTNGKLIRSTYGDPGDLHGGALFDWLPETDKHEPLDPAWKLLTVASAAQPTNIIAL